MGQMQRDFTGVCQLGLDQITYANKEEPELIKCRDYFLIDEADCTTD